MPEPNETKVMYRVPSLKPGEVFQRSDFITLGRLGTTIVFQVLQMDYHDTMANLSGEREGPVDLVPLGRYVFEQEHFARYLAGLQQFLDEAERAGEGLGFKIVTTGDEGE